MLVSVSRSLFRGALSTGERHRANTIRSERLSTKQTNSARLLDIPAISTRGLTDRVRCALQTPLYNSITLLPNCAGLGIFIAFPIFYSVDVTGI